MTINYVLAPEHQRRYVYPSSYGAAAGTPIVGGLIYTYESAAKTTPKSTWNNIDTMPPSLNTNPIELDDSGQCVIYWGYDDSMSASDNFYYVELRDPNNVLIDSYDMYNGVPFPAGSITGSAAQLNFVTNPQFTLNHFIKETFYVGDQAGNTYNPTISNTGGNCYVADDWIWTKSNTTADETASLIPFALNQTAVPNSPVNYLQWLVTTAGTGETSKSIYQFYNKINTFAGQSVLIQFWASSVTSAQPVITIRQYFGTGGSPSAIVATSSSAIALTPVWALHQVTLNVPLVTGTIGTNGDDGVLLCIDLPLDAPLGSTISITNMDGKSSLLTTPLYTELQFPTVNIQATETNRNWFGTPAGEIQSSILTGTQNQGWLFLADGTIGNADSGATDFASENAYALYFYLWTNTVFPVSPNGSGASGTAVLTGTAITSISPLAGGANYGTATTVTFTGGSGSGAVAHPTIVDGVITAVVITAGGSYTVAPTVVFTDPGRGLHAIDDFDNNKKIPLPVNLGRFNIAAGGGYPLGSTGGSEDVGVPAHTHAALPGGAQYVTVTGGITPVNVTPGGATNVVGITGLSLEDATASEGGIVPLLPFYTAFYNFIKL